jgi:LysR family transcriptional regulator, hydrogen peroxide-inducible genes activator
MPPHPFTLRQLQYIVAIAEELSFRRAAERCGVSQPSLSAQLVQVEEALGLTLFERNRKKVLVTVPGRDLVARAKRALLEADDLLRAAARIGDPFAGTMRLGVIPTLAPYLLPSITAPLRKRFPKMRLRWTEDKTDVLVKRLDEGELEGAILALEADIGEVAHHVLAKDPFVLLTPRDHALAKKNTPVTEAELRNEELLLLDEGHCFRTQALEACSAARMNEGEFRATSLTTLVQMVAGGGGITLIPAIAVDMEAKRARLHVRPLAGPAAHRTIALIWRKGSALAPTLETLATALRQSYPKAAHPCGP